MTGNQVERKRIVVDIKFLSARNAITLVHQPVLLRRIQTVLEIIYRKVIARLLAISKSEGVHPVELQEIRRKTLCIESARHAGIDFTITYQFFRRNIDVGTCHIGIRVAIKSFV